MSEPDLRKLGIARGSGVCPWEDGLNEGVTRGLTWRGRRCRLRGFHRATASFGWITHGKLRVDVSAATLCTWAAAREHTLDRCEQTEHRRYSDSHSQRSVKWAKDVDRYTCRTPQCHTYSHSTDHTAQVTCVHGSSLSCVPKNRSFIHAPCFTLRLTLHRKDTCCQTSKFQKEQLRRALRHCPTRTSKTSNYVSCWLHHCIYECERKMKDKHELITLNGKA